MTPASHEDDARWCEHHDALALGEATPSLSLDDAQDPAWQAEHDFYEGLRSEAQAQSSQDDEAFIDAFLAEHDGATASPEAAATKEPTGRRAGMMFAVVLTVAAAVALWHFGPSLLTPTERDTSYQQASQSQASGGPAEPVRQPTEHGAPSQPAPAPEITPEPEIDTAPAIEPTAEPISESEEPAHARANPPRTQGATAAELLARGRTKRAQGDTRGAIAAYSTVIKRYPNTGEATAARVPLGQLYLARGKARAALGVFGQYLRSKGPLAEEAHWGTVQALHRLGRAEALSEAIANFERHYPRSVYLERARELGR